MGTQAKLGEANALRPEIERDYAGGRNHVLGGSKIAGIGHDLARSPRFRQAVL